MGLNKRLIGAGATASGALTPSENFKAVLYTGNGGTQAITGVGFQPDFVWCKTRSASGDHNVTDSTRGIQKGLNPNLTSVEGNQAPLGVTSFGTDGFTVVDNSGGGASVNGNGITYVAWCWKANGGTTSSNTDGSITSTVQTNADAGFSIVKYTGTGADATVGHGLSAAPDLLIVKGLETTNDWSVLHKDGGAGDFLQLNKNSAESGAGSIFGSTFTRPTSTVFSIGNTGETGTNTLDYIAYCFKGVDGFSKFGSYTGNGSANGPIIETGFEPAFIMVKRYNTVSNWVIYDNKRNTTNPRFSYLMANTNTAETGTAGDAAPQLDFLSNGFQPSGTEGYVNANGDSYIYMAFAADPDTEAPTLASSFNIETYTGNGSTQSISGLGFAPNLVWLKERGQAANHRFIDTIRGATKAISSSLTNAEFTDATGLTSFDTNGFSLGNNVDYNNNGGTFVAWTWKADDNEPTIFGGPAKAVYKFEDNANDVTGNYNATATNVSYSSSGKFNKAAEFNGSSSKIDLPNNPIGTNLKGSVSLWVSGSSLTNTATSVNMIFYNTNPYIALDTYDSNLRLTVKDSSSSNTTISYATSNFNATDWYHIAYVFNGTSSTFELFVNGSSVGTATAPSSTTNVASAGYIGHGGNYQYFTGKIDQVRFYNGSFKAEQVDELYAETASQNDNLTLGGPPETIISANANAGFSIVKWEGNGSAGKIPHGLSAAPEMIITKRLTGTSPWYTYNAYLNGGANPAHYFVNLNTSDAETSNGSSGGSLFNSTPPTSTIFNIGTSLSGSGDEYIAYCFHSVSGYSKISSYSGNSTSGRLINIGFKPDWVMIKTTNATSNWFIIDSVRGGLKDLRPNASNAEETRTNGLTFVSNGFEIDDTSVGFNNSGTEYIYMAFKIN